jgi:hypothetical protein
VPAQAARELSDGELQSEGEKQQYHADRCAGADELRSGRDRRDASFTEGETGQQIQRNRR